jgi:hypothetical protein
MSHEVIPSTLRSAKHRNHMRDRNACLLGQFDPATNREELLCGGGLHGAFPLMHLSRAIYHWLEKPPPPLSSFNQFTMRSDHTNGMSPQSTSCIPLARP